MKAIFKLLSPTIILFLLLSCGDDEKANESASLVGKWKVTNFDYIECTDPADNLLRVCGTQAFCTTWEFTADGNSTIFYTSGVGSTLTYTIYPGNTVSLCDSRACTSMIYAISGNTLVLTTTPPSSNINGCTHQYTFVKV